MKSMQSIGTLLEKGRVLQKEKETERNWSKIDQVLESMLEVQKKEDLEQLAELMKLICIAIQSNRSKLSGTGCKAAIHLFERISDKVSDSLPYIVPALMSAVSKSNKVISSRAHSVLSVISEKCAIYGIVKYLKTQANTQNRSIRLVILEMIKNSLPRERHSDLLRLLEEMACDPLPEIREKARASIGILAAVDRKVYTELLARLPEKVIQMLPVQHAITPEGRRLEESMHLLSRVEQAFKSFSQDEESGSEAVKREQEDLEKNQLRQASNEICQPVLPLSSDTVPSVITNMDSSPRLGQIKIRSGSGVIVRGPIRSYVPSVHAQTHQEAPKTPQNNRRMSFSPLKPGHSLERIGIRLEEHKREIEESLKRERTPRKTPVTKKRFWEGEETPSSLPKREKEDFFKENDLVENVSINLSRLSISKMEETDQCTVAAQEIHEDVFQENLKKEPNEFLKACAEQIQITTESDISMIENIIQDATLPDASLHEELLHNASLHEESLHNTSLHNASLHNVSLHNASLHDASLHNTSIHNASLHEVAHEAVDQTYDESGYSILCPNISVKRSTTEKVDEQK
ncbi:hypothetical protein NEFER03_0918 [Nematocida sp. LUAm3]|nr:hypothetical protein NEFER03_0918 [Nematocida sp. LUAm3]KAI5174936.1 hypothetical protein NEFER02_1036 [Nematocida sp. LUAm2]KAI5177465.1 hypothetical protein NEFER01_0715 [Nematocida sp. LUAm1]